MRVTVVLALLVVCGAAAAQPCGTRIVCPTPYVAPTIVSPVVERVRYVDDAQVVVFVPTFTVSYQNHLPYPPGIGGSVPAGYGVTPPAPLQQASGAGFAECLVEIKKISARLDNLEARMAGAGPTPRRAEIPPADQTPPQPAAKLETRNTIIRTSCAVCHTQGKLDKDAELVMVDDKGGIVKLTAEQEIEVTRRVYAAEMPPPKNKKGVLALTDEQVKKMIFPEGGVK